MAIRPRHRRSLEFSAAAMSDIIFQLLIFFVLILSINAQVGVQIDLPTSGSQQAAEGRTSVTITATGEFYWNGARTARAQIPELIAKALAEPGARKTITLQTDKRVTMEDATFVMAAIAKGKGKVVIATRKPDA
jgi:biopolymer transport protein ExbD